MGQHIICGVDAHEARLDCRIGVGRSGGSEEKAIREHAGGSPSVVELKTASSTWARLIVKVYEVDPLQCAQCGSPMRVLAMIMDPVEADKILSHLIKTGRAPPGLQELAQT